MTNPSEKALVRFVSVDMMRLMRSAGDPGDFAGMSVRAA